MRNGNSKNFAWDDIDEIHVHETCPTFYFPVNLEYCMAWYRDLIRHRMSRRMSSRI